MLTSITEVRLARVIIRRLFACVLLQSDSLHFAQSRHERRARPVLLRASWNIVGSKKGTRLPSL